MCLTIIYEWVVEELWLTLPVFESAPPLNTQSPLTRSVTSGRHKGSRDSA